MAFQVDFNIETCWRHLNIFAALQGVKKFHKPYLLKPKLKFQSNEITINTFMLPTFIKDFMSDLLKAFNIKSF